MPNILLAIDPGTVQSALVVVTDGVPGAAEILPNDALRRELLVAAYPVVLEQVAQGGVNGKAVFETVFWTGRFFEAALSAGVVVHRIPRVAVKRHLLGKVIGGDKEVRQALLRRFGGDAVALGTKALPGPLRHVTSHCWAALAVGLTWYDQQVAAGVAAPRGTECGRCHGLGAEADYAGQLSRPCPDCRGNGRPAPDPLGA